MNTPNWINADGTIDRENLRDAVLVNVVQPTWDSFLKRTLEQSPLLKDNGGSYKTRITASGLVGALPMPSLIALATGERNARDLADVLASPITQDYFGALYVDAKSAAKGQEAALGRIGLKRISHPKAPLRVGMIDGSATAPAQTASVPIMPFTPPVVAPESVVVPRSTLAQPNANGGTNMNAIAQQVSGKTIDPTFATMIDAQLGVLQLPKLNEMLKAIKDSATQILTLEDELERAKAQTGITINVSNQTAPKPGMPNLKNVAMKKAADVFAIAGTARNLFSFDVPVFEWDAAHPHVPDADQNFLFRPEQLAQVLYALVKNKPAWLYGHTGTGKSTLLQQVCSRLQWPALIVNMDSDISRVEFLGRDGLFTDPNTNTTITKFVDGVLPQAVQGPYCLIVDEWSYGRPDVIICTQRPLEGKGLLVAEDGGRYVAPHPFFRIFATCSTRGQGDDTGLYQGARIQPGSQIDRFKVWLEVGYMKEDEVISLINRKVPGLKPETVRLIAQYTIEHQRGFVEKQVTTPWSPRGFLALAEAFQFWMGLAPEAMAKRFALEQTIINQAPDTDKAVLKGIVNRVFDMSL